MEVGPERDEQRGADERGRERGDIHRPERLEAAFRRRGGVCEAGREDREDPGNDEQDRLVGAPERDQERQGGRDGPERPVATPAATFTVITVLSDTLPTLAWSVTTPGSMAVKRPWALIVPTSPCTEKNGVMPEAGDTWAVNCSVLPA